MRPLNVQSLLCESSTVFGDSRIFELDHPSLSDESDGHWKFAAAGGLLELMPWPRINVEKNGIERILDIAAQAEPLQDADENVCFDTSAHVPRLTAPMLECKQKAVPIPSIQLLRSMEPLETRSTVGLELRLDWTILTKGKISYVHSVDMVEPTLQYNDVSKLVMSPAQPISFIRWLSSDTMLQETLHMYDHARGEDEEFLPTYALGNRAACFCPPAWQEPKFCDLPSDHIDLLQRLRSDHDRCLGLPEALSLPMEYGTFPPDLQRLKALESETRCVNERQSAASVLAETLLTLGTCGRMVFNYDRVAGLVFLQHKLRSCPKIEAYIRHVRPIIQQTVHQKALPTHPKLATTLVDQFVRLSLQKHVRVILVMDIQAAFLALRQIAAYTRFMPLLFDPDSSRLWSLGLNSRSPNDAARSINSIFESDVNVCIVPAYVLERALIATDENLLGTHIVSLHSVNDEPGLKASIDNRANGYIIYQLLTREIDLTQSTSTGVAATPATEARRYNDACIHSLEYDVPNKRHKKASDEEVQLPAQRDSQESGNDDRHSDPGVSGTVISDARFASTSQRDLRFCYTHNQGSEAEHGTSNVQPQAAPLAIPKRCNRTFNDHGSSVLDGQTCHPHDGHENTSSNRQMIVGVINTARPLVNQQNIATRLQHLQNEQHRCTFSKRTLEHGADLVLWTDSGIIGLVLLAADASESQTWDDVLQDTASSLAAACSIYAAVFVICSLSGAGVAGAEVAFGKFDGILRASVLDATIVVMTVREVEAVANAVSGIVQNVKPGSCLKATLYCTCQRRNSQHGVSLSFFPGWGSTALIELLRNEESIEYEALLESKYALDPFTCSALARSGLKIENVSAGRHPMSLEEIQETVVEISRFCIPPKAVYRLDAVLKDLHSKSRFDGFNEDQRQSSTSSYFPELVNGDEDDNAAHRAEDGINTIAAQKAEKERYEWLKHSYVPDENLHPPYEDATTELREDQLCSISEEEEKARRLRTQDANQKHVHNGGSIRDMAEQFFSKRQRGQAELKKAQMDVSNPKHVHNLRKGLPSQNCRETAAHDLTQPRLQSSHDDSMHETWAQLGLAPPPDEADESIWNASSSRSMESQYSEAKPYSKRREAQKQLTSSVYLEQFRYNNDVSAPQKKQQQQQKGMKDIRTWLRQGSDSCSSETELKSSYLPSRSRGHAEGRLTASKRKTSEGSTGSCQTKHRRGSSDSGQSSSSGTRRSGAPLSESVLQRMRQRIGTT